MSLKDAVEEPPIKDLIDIIPEDKTLPYDMKRVVRDIVR